MIEISESKVDKLSEHASKALKHIGRLMECVEEIYGDDEMGERRGDDRDGRYGNRYDGVGRYGNRYDMRDDEDWGDDEIGERRGRSSRTGRYTRR